MKTDPAVIVAEGYYRLKSVNEKQEQEIACIKLSLKHHVARLAANDKTLSDIGELLGNDAMPAQEMIRRIAGLLQFPAMEAITVSERDEDAFNNWNRDVTDYEPSLFDAYCFGLSRGRASMP